MTNTNGDDQSLVGVEQRIQTLLGEKRLNEAEILCEELCSHDSTNALAWGLRGAIYSARGLMENAVENYRLACRIRPQDAALNCNLGYALQSLRRYAEAAEYYERALLLQPESAQIEVNLGYVLLSQGFFNEALTHYQRARKLSPHLESAITGEADVLEKMGCQQQAYYLIKPSIEAGSNYTGMVCLYAELSRDLGFQEEALSVLGRALSQTCITDLELARLNFKAGCINDDLGRYDEAFSHYELGNQLAGSDYDSDSHEKMITETITVFSAERLSRMPRATNHSEKPIFVIGMPRSGTSLVEQILASHPHVFGGGELPYIHDMALGLASELATNQSYLECCKKLTPEFVNQLASRYLLKLDILSKDSLRVTDKMPHNFLHLGLIALLFPSANIIHCVRNPLDTCLSGYFRLYESGNEYSYDLNSLGRHYAQYSRLMKHWKDVLKIPMLDVHYEDLVEKQASISRAIVEFSGLNWDVDCLRFHNKERPNLSPNYNEVRKPIYRRSIKRWQMYTAHLDPLRVALGNIESD